MHKKTEWRHFFRPACADGEIAKDLTRSQIAEAQKLSRDYWEAYGPDREDE